MDDFDFENSSKKFKKLLTNFKSFESLLFEIALEPDLLIECNVGTNSNFNSCSKTKKIYGFGMLLCYEIIFPTNVLGMNLLQNSPRSYKMSFNLNEISEAVALENRPGRIVSPSTFQINFDNERANFGNTFEHQFQIGSISNLIINPTKLKMLNVADESCTQMDTQVPCYIDCIQSIYGKLFNCQPYLDENHLLL